MAINNDIITTPKLLEFEKVIEYNDWEECEHLVNQSVLGGMDWYLIEGLMEDLYFVLKGKYTSETPEEFIKMINDLFDNQNTKSTFVQMTKNMEYE